MSSTQSISEIIQAQIQEYPVLLYMKGNPGQPSCGFSAAVAALLTKLNIPFHGINILENPELRQGIKAFSNWPTIPQLYVKGEFIGGCDIIREMYHAGELQTLFQEKGIQSP